jgi:hypothetical protein
VKALAAGLLLVALGARAEIPDIYAPLVVRAAPDTSAERVFDLTGAFDTARRLNRPLFVYVGAADCPFCKQYTQFLESHGREMHPVFTKVVLVDIRATLRGPRPTFTLHGQRYSTVEFKALIGDTNPGLSYPTWWLLTPDAKQVRQLPRDVEQFIDVKRYDEWFAGFRPLKTRNAHD